MSEARSPETFGFQAEVRQLLHLMVHSLYSDREIFLRELISNASDAADRLRFEALANPDLVGDTELAIEIAIDRDAGTLTVSDNGIGMSRGEIIEQLGTIAHSGTARYLENLTGDQQKDSQLIGQFGVGFYSSFIVADEVEVSSRRADLPADDGALWRSDGQGEYSLQDIEKADRGTTVRLKLKADASEFLEEARIRTLIRKYSDHISFPVRMSGAVADNGDEQTVNRAKALWTRPRTEVDDDEYTEFYRHIAHDFSDPLTWSHNRVEGKREYTSLLYIPSVAPFDLWNRESPKGVKLYVQRVFITDRATEFLPLYLRFVRGVVDCADLSLNVSREMIQQDPSVGAMKSALTKRVLDLLGKLSKDDSDKYATFWEQFGTTLKEGLAEDSSNREKIAGLLRFNSTQSDDVAPDRSLADYLDNAADDQESIYYLLADSALAARSSPHLEAFRERGIEVLLLSDRIDEWAMQFLDEYKGKSFRDIGRGELDLDEDDETKPVDPGEDKERKQLVKRIKRVLRERVDEVRVSTRLKESAACLVLNEHDLGHQMRELLKASGQQAPASLPNLEINPSHPLIGRLAAEADDDRFALLSTVILDQAMLAEGRQLDDPAAFVRRVNELLLDADAG